VTRDRPRVLLLWPGGLLGGGRNFGVPQLLMLANAVKRAADAEVDVVDLDLERALGTVDLRRLLAPGYDLIGVSCYSSFDYLKVMAIGEQLKALAPRAWLVTGGYHPSARPDDFTGPDSPFDFVVVGDGERPLARLASALVSGKRPLNRVLGPEPVADIRELVPYDWSLLERYRPIARRVASQAEIYLSRGCPYDCAFCMERAKRDVSWRALEPEQAHEEMHRLDRFLDLRTWTLFVADALFGMKRGWRRSFLELLARRPVRARRVWLLIRVDLIEREDLELMARANVSPGFGLESGDPDHLKRIRKAGRLDDYLEKMLVVGEWARQLDVPFGANIIVGHPGETEQTLRTTARYLTRLYLEPSAGTHGFLSVDPFRLYPGSPIDAERPEWERLTGFRARRYPWWHDGDQEFLSEWVDPSGALDFRTVTRLRHELLDPVVRGIAGGFSWQGPARDYFMRAVDEQVQLITPARRLHTLGLYHLWRGLNDGGTPEARRTELVGDGELEAIARAARADTLSTRGLHGSPALLAALHDVPRERFVPAEHVAHSAADCALPLSENGRSTISALHAYAEVFDALELAAGDDFTELGAGTGYGAALAAATVGGSGTVRALEVDPELAALARRNLEPATNVQVLAADAHDVGIWRGARKVSCAFAVDQVPSAWLEALAEGGVLVAPVGAGSEQTLTVFRKAGGTVTRAARGRVRYVRDRSGASVASATSDLIATGS
jgi:protein-L-isoaspartate(D-aspartate) O-methyltransferase